MSQATERVAYASAFFLSFHSLQYLTVYCGVVSRKIFQKNQKAAISLCLTFGLWKYGNPAIRFVLNNLFYHTITKKSEALFV